ncbi:MAG TPA: hypothetical protein VNQ73_22425 [Ilumatobacter sp.]|nr:hypothetical protein [Ilumatobacter sp.]
MSERRDDAPDVSPEREPPEPAEHPAQPFADHWDDDPDEFADTGDDAYLDDGDETGATDDTPAGADWTPTGAAGVALSLPQRAARRVVRRPVEWAQRPWPNERIIQYVVTVLTLTTTTVIMSNVVHLSFLPGRDLIFDDTTPTGGDFGAHVWGPAYLRDHLLPGWFNGWSMDWYAGLPTYRFYMVLPAMAILLVNVVLPYGVAMKLVSILGVVTIPAMCWAFGRLAKFRYPVPELMAFGGLAFVLDESFEIYGGNVKSTMAGEFSFSIALAILILALGVLAAGLRTGKYRVWASVLLAAAAVSHGIVLIYTAVTAILLCAVWVDRQRWKYAITVGVTTLLLSMWWVGPFLLSHDFMTDMKYEGKPDWADSYWSMFFPHDTVLDFIISGLAVLGFLLCIVRRQLNGVALGVTCLIFIGGVYATRDGGLPGIGLLWNPRLLPYIYLTRYLLMVVGAFELLTLLWNAMTDRRALQWPSVGPATAFFAIPAVSVLLVLGWMYQELPGGQLEVKNEGKPAVYTWGPLSAPQGEEQTKRAQADGWARYNFRGYEGRDQYYTEYYNVVNTMADLGNNPEYGCGRANWENNADNGPYGTTMALMLLPFWTDGCIASMEGLFFEASGTTPFHFLTTAALSEKSSNPVRQLRYVDHNGAIGVRHAQNLGVKYVMVRTDVAKREAAAQPDLTLIAQSYPWDVYLVADSDVVVPLAVQPVVVNGRSGDQRERNLELGTSWFQNPDEWAAMPADGGPAEWQHIDVVVDEARHSVNASNGKQDKVDYVVPAETINPVALPDVTVSNLVMEQQSLSFDVDRVGVPVLVKVSYFPNWQASGADGPWRIGPNMMVVVPTSEHVELSFERAFSDYFTLLLTLVGVGLCVLWRRQGDLEFDSEMPGALLAPAAAAAPPAPDTYVWHPALDTDDPGADADPGAQHLWGRPEDAETEPDPWGADTPTAAPLDTSVDGLADEPDELGGSEPTRQG